MGYKTKTFTFDTDFEDFVGDSVIKRNASEGHLLAGSLQIQAVDLTNISVSAKQTVGNTWVDLGLPLDAKILSFSVSSYWLKTSVFNAYGLLSVNVYSNGVLITSHLISDLLSSTSGSWAKQQTGVLTVIPDAYIDVTTPIEFEITYYQQFVSAITNIFLDEISIQIHYLGGNKLIPVPSIQRQWTFGVESTAGTAATPTLISTELECMFSEKHQNKEYRRKGIKAATNQQKGFRHSVSQITGVPGFNVLAYLNQSLFKVATGSNPTKNGVWAFNVGAASAGTFTLTFGGQTTSSIAFGASAATVQAALEALSTIGQGNVLVALVTAGSWTATFRGALSFNVGAMTGAGTGLTGGSFTIAGSSSASAAYDWNWTPAFQGADTIKTYTFQEGIPAVASSGHTIPYGVIDGYTIDYNEASINLSGGAFGQKLTSAITPTTVSAGGVITPAPFDMTGTRVLFGENLISATNGLQILDNMLNLQVGITNRWKPNFRLTTNNDSSYGGILESESTNSVTFTVAKDTVEDSILSILNNGTLCFVVVETVGSLIETGYSYLHRTICPIKIKDQATNDTNDEWSSQYPCEIFFDAGVGYWFKEDLRCAIATI